MGRKVARDPGAIQSQGPEVEALVPSQGSPSWPVGAKVQVKWGVHQHLEVNDSGQDVTVPWEGWGHGHPCSEMAPGGDRMAKQADSPAVERESRGQETTRVAKAARGQNDALGRSEEAGRGAGQPAEGRPSRRWVVKWAPPG